MQVIRVESIYLLYYCTIAEGWGDGKRGWANYGMCLCSISKDLFVFVSIGPPWKWDATYHCKNYLMTTFVIPCKTFVFSFLLYHIVMDQTRWPLWPLPQSSADPVGATHSLLFVARVSLGSFDRAERLAIHSCQAALLLLCHPDCLHYLTSPETVQLRQPQLSVCLHVGQIRLTIRTLVPLLAGGLAGNLKHMTTTERTIMQNYCEGTQSSPERNTQHDPLVPSTTNLIA